MLDEYRGIPRQAQLLVILSAVPSIALGWLTTDISYYLTTVQGVPTVWGGLTISMFGYAVVVSSIPLGILADRVGRRKLLILERRPGSEPAGVRPDHERRAAGTVRGVGGAGRGGLRRFPERPDSRPGGGCQEDLGLLARILRQLDRDGRWSRSDQLCRCRGQR